VKFKLVVFDVRDRADRQTDTNRHTDTLIAILCTRILDCVLK